MKIVEIILLQKKLSSSMRISRGGFNVRNHTEGKNLKQTDRIAENIFEVRDILVKERLA